MARTGRRPGESGTRDAILAAARARFAEVGYPAATIRDIADDAGVDPALVHHYFGTKRALFTAVLDLPVDPAELVLDALDGDPDELGPRLANRILEAWDSPDGGRRIRALLRAALADEDGTERLRAYVTESVLDPLTDAAVPDDARLRAALAGSQIVGLALARYVVGVPPLATADRERVAGYVGDTLQRYLRGDGGGAERG
jgi:AcrR family transcriptional regulator